MFRKVKIQPIMGHNKLYVRKITVSPFHATFSKYTGYCNPASRDIFDIKNAKDCPYVRPDEDYNIANR